MIDPSMICYKCMSRLTAPDAPCPHCGAVGSELRNQANQLPIGSILAGKYIVGCTLGQGGFGITYIGWDLNLDNKLAIKEFYPEGFVSRNNTNQSTVLPLSGERGAYFQNSREKFVEEARTLARFSSDPGIVSVHDFFNENGTSYIVMDFIDGKTLKCLAEERGGTLPAQEVLRYLLPVMDSLANVHAAGLLHRDISPDNIIVRSSDDRAVLLDFGAARQISAMGEHSNTINVKHGFAPEEQYRTRGEQGPWTDVYALCATIYRLTTGITPLPANDRIGPDGDTLAPITRLVVGISSAQKAAIMKGLSVWGKDRQQTMAGLKAELIGSSGSAGRGAGQFPGRSSSDGNSFERADGSPIRDGEPMRQTAKEAENRSSGQAQAAERTAKQDDPQAASMERAKAARRKKRTILLSVAAAAVAAVTLLCLTVPRDRDSEALANADNTGEATASSAEQGSDSGPAMPAATEEPAPEPKEFQRGVWTDTVYENEYLNLRFTKPEGFLSATDAEIAAMMEINEEVLENDNLNELQKKLAALKTIYDMMVSDPVTGNSVIVMLENLELSIGASGITPEEYAEIVKEQMNDTEISGYKYTVQEGYTEELGGESFYVLPAVLGDGLMLQNFYLRRVDGYMLAICITIVGGYEAEEASIKEAFTAFDA